MHAQVLADKLRLLSRLLSARSKTIHSVRHTSRIASSVSLLEASIGALSRAPWSSTGLFSSRLSGSRYHLEECVGLTNFCAGRGGIVQPPDDNV